VDRLLLFSHRGTRLSIAVVTLAIALLLAGGNFPRSGSAATAVAGVLPIPRADGVTIGYSGTDDPKLLVAAQPFGIASLAKFHVASQTWTTYVPGAPAFANTLTPLNLRPDSIVFARRTTSAALNGSPTPLAGPPIAVFTGQPTTFEIPPPDGLTLGISGTTIPEALVASQFFETQTMNVWNVQQQRYLTFIPGAPAIVNTLNASNLQPTDFVWLKTEGGATGGLLLEDTPFLARLVPFGAAGTLLGVDEPLNGTLIDNGDGSVTYLPDENFNGDDSFTYTVMTPDGPEIRTFRLKVTPENDPPIAIDDAAVSEDGKAILIAVLDNDEDPDDDPIEILRTTQPSNGIVAVAGNGVLYTPNPKFTGVDVFSYEITDGETEPGEEDSIAEVFVAVGGAALAGPPPSGGGGGGTPPGGEDPGGEGDPPFLSDDSAHLDTCEAPAVIDVLANDAGDGITVLAIASVSAPTLGTAVSNGDGTVTYTPPVECTGADAFSYTVLDGEGLEQSANVSVTMGEQDPGENQAPEAFDDSGATFADEPVTIDLLGNDSDPDDDPLTVIEVTQPAGGSVVDNGDGTVTYTANGYVGQTSFTYTISDGRGGEASASVSVSIEGAPVAPHGPVVVQAGGQVTIQVVSPSTFVQLESVTQGSHGSTSMDAGAGTVTYHAEAGYDGDDWITWTLRFSHGGTAETTLQMQVVN